MGNSLWISGYTGCPSRDLLRDRYSGNGGTENTGLYGNLVRGTGPLTPQFCRNLAKEAQVPVFLESNDFSGTGSGILYVSALSPGNKTISLPEGITRCTSLTGQKFLQMGNKVSVHLETGELLILKLQTENTPQ